MIKINYDKKPHVFDLSFCLKEYIPIQYFEKSKGGADAKLYFYINLLIKNNMMLPKKSSVHQMIWSIHYDCFYNQIPFTMIYDENYGFVSFAVKNLKDRTKIAELLKNLVKNEQQPSL